MTRLEVLIAEAPVFAGLKASSLALLADCAGNEHVRGGEFLFHRGEQADRCLLIGHGLVALETHGSESRSLEIDTLGDGEVVGWSWLFHPFRWHFDARATQPTDLISFDGACLRRKCDADHTLGYQLMERFASAILDRLQDTRVQLLDVYANPSATD